MAHAGLVDVLDACVLQAVRRADGELKLVDALGITAGEVGFLVCIDAQIEERLFAIFQVEDQLG